MGTMGENYGAYQKNKYAARQAESEGRATKTAAYKQADNLEQESQTDSHIAAMNMSRMAANKNSAKATVRANKGASGLTSQGSANQPEIAIADAFDQAISDMSLSNAVNDQNKRHAATMTRYQGDLGMQAANATASQYRILGQNALQSMQADMMATVAAALIGSSGMVNSTEKDSKGNFIPHSGMQGALSMGSKAYLISGDINSGVPGSASRNTGYLSQWIAEFSKPRT